MIYASRQVIKFTGSSLQSMTTWYVGNEGLGNDSSSNLYLIDIFLRDLPFRHHQLS